MRPPQSADDDLVIAERVVQMEGNPPQVDSADVRDWGSRIDRAGTGKERDDLQRLFKFFREHVSSVAVLEPPRFFARDMLLRDESKTDETLLQRDRS